MIQNANFMELTETQKRHQFFAQKLGNSVLSNNRKVESILDNIEDEKLNNLTTEIKRLTNEKKARLYELSVTDKKCLESYNDMIEFAFYKWCNNLHMQAKEIDTLFVKAKKCGYLTPSEPLNTTNKLSNFIEEALKNVRGKVTTKVKSISFDKALESITTPIFDGIKSRYRKQLGIVGATNKANEIVDWYTKRAKNNDLFASSFNNQLRFLVGKEENKK